MSRAINETPYRHEEDEEEEDDMDPFFRAHSTITMPATQLDSIPAEEEDAEHLYVNAIELSDEDIEEGMVEEVEEGEVDDRCLEGVLLPTFDDEKRLYLLDLQDDDDIRRCKGMLEDEEMLPDKLSVLQESWSVQQFLRHRSLFRLTSQNILIRIWVEPDGRMTQLIVV